MKTILHKLSQKLISSEQDQQDLRAYQDMQKHTGWVIHQQLLLLMHGMIAERLLSDKFTKLGRVEKDIEQRTFHQVDEVIMFLLNPLKHASKMTVIKKFNQRMSDAFTKATTREQP